MGWQQAHMCSLSAGLKASESCSDWLCALLVALTDGSTRDPAREALDKTLAHTVFALFLILSFCKKESGR